MSVTMHEVKVKSLNTPDEHRAPKKASVDVNHLSGYTIGRLSMEPGWTWSESIKPIVNTETCQLLHVGYCVSGKLETRLEDGSRATILAGDSYVIPPGHDAKVVGDETFVGIEFSSAAEFGVPGR